MPDYPQTPKPGAPSRRQVIAAGAGALVVLPPPEQGDPKPMDVPGLTKRMRTPHKHPTLVVSPSYKKGEFDSHAVDCPFVFRHGTRFLMTYIGFDGIGYRTGLASSDDLVNWKREGLLIDRGPKGSVTEFNVALTWILRENDLYGQGRLKKVHGKYLGTYHAYPNAGYEAGPAVIGLCWSVDLRQWHLEEPCLHAEDGADWERAGLYKSCLIEADGAYYLFYNAKNKENGWVEQIGYATSTDLKEWTRNDTNPVLKVGPKGSFDDVFASDPCVLRMGDCWAMFYYTLTSSDGHARDSVAFSRDLHEWTKSNEALIDVGPAGSIDSQYAHKPSVYALRGKLHHYYCAVSPCPAGKMGEIDTGEVRGIALATG